MNKEKVTFTGYDIQDFSFTKKDDIPKECQDKLNINKKILQNSKNEELFCLKMQLNINTKDSTITIIVNGYFEISKSIDDELRHSFLNVSAPAIVYPYIRTLISEITAFGSGETVILPIINFAELNYDNED